MNATTIRLYRAASRRILIVDYSESHGTEDSRIAD
jgi:hypothetical protein